MSLKRRDPTTTKPQRKPPTKRPGFDEQEERVADAIGGERVRGSGCSRRPDRKGDAASDIFRAETKTTSARGIRVDRDYLTKIRSEALATGCRPIFAFGFDGNRREDWIAFELADAELLIDLLNATLRDDPVEARRIAGLLLP